MDLIMFNPPAASAGKNFTTSRPSSMFDGSASLAVTVQIPADCCCLLTVDGEKNVDILSEDTVKIKKSELCLELISLRKRNFFKLLNEKLKEREM